MTRKLYVLGSINIDYAIECQRFPKVGETLCGSGFGRTLGGKGTNQAIAASVLGMQTQFIGAVGSNDDNEWIYEEFKHYQVDITSVSERQNVNTGTAVIVKADGDNMIILDKGANSCIETKPLYAVLNTATENDYFLTQLEVDLQVVYKGIEIAAQKGMTVILNPAPAINLDTKIYSLVDYLVVNQTEAELLSGIYPENREDCRAVFQFFHTYGLKNLVVTLGRQGSVWVAENQAIFVEGIAVSAVDSTGAGDAFIGMFVTGLSMGISMRLNLKYANIAGAMTCVKKGARIGVENKEAILNFKA